MDLVALNGALQRLAEIDPRKSRIMEMRFSWRPDPGRNFRGFRNWSSDCTTRLDNGAILAASRGFPSFSPVNADGWERPKQTLEEGTSAQAAFDHSGLRLAIAGASPHAK